MPSDCAFAVEAENACQDRSGQFGGQLEQGSVSRVLGSTLGGHRGWVQGADYPHCLSCGVPMAFVALLHGGDFDQWGEGAHFVFLDARCGLAAVNYRQS